MALELKDKEIAAITLYPGSVATEFILASGRDPSGAQTTLGVGRTVAAVAEVDELQHRSFVLVTFVSGSVGAVKFAV